MSYLRFMRRLCMIGMIKGSASDVYIRKEYGRLYDNLKLDCRQIAYSARQNVQHGSVLNLLSNGVFNKQRLSKGDSNNNSNRNIEKAILSLNSSIKKSSRIYKADLEKILMDIRTRGKSQDNYGLLLLQCCGDLLPDEHPAARVDLAHKVWKDLQHPGKTVSVEHYNALLSCYAENHHCVSSSKFIADMGDVEPNETTYQLLLACLCEVGDMDQATEVVAIMKSKGYAASELVFSSLVLGYARQGNMKSAVGLLDLMVASNISPASRTYTALLQGFAEAGDLKKLLETHEEAAVKNIVFSAKEVMKVVKSLAVSGNHNVIKDVLSWLPEMNEESRSDVKHTAVHLLHLGYEDAALDVLAAVPTTYESDSSSSFGVFFIHEMVRMNMPVSKIVLLTDSLVSDERNVQALERALGVALSLGKVETVLSLFDAMKHRNKSIRPHYFWPLFIAASRADGEQGVFEILRCMHKWEVDPDFDTLLDYVLPHITLSDPQVVIRKLQDCGLTVSAILSPLLAELLNAGKMAIVVQLCREYKGHLHSDRLVQPLFFAYVTTRQVGLTVKMLQLLTERATQASDFAGQLIFNAVVFRKIRTDPDQLLELLQAYQQAKLNISSFVTDFIFQYLHTKLPAERVSAVRPLVESLVSADLLIAPSENLSFHIPHPREMSLEDLECHLVELRSKDLNKRGVLRRLIQKYCQHGKVEKALEAKQEFQDAGYEFSAGMLAILFDSMIHVGNIDAAEKTLKELQETAPNFVIDEHKIIDFATLLVSKNRDKAAATVLEHRAAMQQVKGGTAVSRNCWRLLNAVAETGDPGHTRQMLEKLTRLGYCSVNNVLLGPVVRTYLNRNDLEGAVKEFRRCAQQHRATPLQQELLSQLVVQAKGDPSHRAAELVEQVMQSGGKVHGAASMQVLLAVVLAETGLTQQLRRFLMSLRGEFKSSLFIARCKRLADEDKLTALENIVRASKGTSNLDLQPICILMLKIYSRRGDCDGALKLWRTIEDEDLKPSPQFLTILAELLHSHKREVPFSVPSDEDPVPASSTPSDHTLFSQVQHSFSGKKADALTTPVERSRHNA